MIAKMPQRLGITLGIVILVYFIVFPEDITSITSPLAKILEISNSISMGLYLVIAAGILAWSALQIWGRRTSEPVKVQESSTQFTRQD